MKYIYSGIKWDENKVEYVNMKSENEICKYEIRKMKCEFRKWKYERNERN